ncbi:MAG: NUDIX hydrolase [Silicimonas sp.]|nr:NUDIX hydrolase [Silicimonas sp.]NNL35543.1 NUDIX hydrolase [Silicimonas sp.]NNL73702.1 NUDIX hydrolase [Silicimonas sp.]
MSLTRIKQRPLRLADGGKRDVRTQFGALCWRVVNDKVQVLLITSRRRKRWILPKGWPMDEATPVEAAQTEAWEEAGVTGKAQSVCLGIYSYIKEMDEGEQLPCVVAVFPVKVKKIRSDWPEKSMRRRKWMSLKEASKAVAEKELADIIAGFDPDDL